ncbi:MAG TPA: polyprenyl synthetase family protein [Patescibacteria group bacterium]
MDAKQTLAELKKKIDPKIERYLNLVIEDTEKTDKNVADALRYVKKIILAGGKRARAVFMYYGYLAAGGKDLKNIIRISISIELIHMFLLMHDDIIDQDDKRHGVTTIHKRYESLGKKFLKIRNPEHFGNSMAIIVGDMLGALGNRVIYESDFRPELIVKALHKLQDIVSMTCIGETEDIYIENKGKATEKEIILMYENKTAKYTIEGPLHLGAILAGADDNFLKIFSEYAIPVGIAFQIQDDILGIFGNEEKMGKPVGSDVRQGKQTILVAKAYEKADFKQEKILDKTLGNRSLTLEELEEFKKVIMETGSLDYAKNLSLSLVAKGKKALESSSSQVRMEKEAEDFLLSIGDYIISRTV